MQKDLLTVEEVTRQDLDNIFKLATKMKLERLDYPVRHLAGKSIGMIFSKSSTRTRVSFEVGIRELDGFPIFLDQNDLQLGRGETIKDTALVLSRYLHAVVIRTHEHGELVEFAKFAHIPVINALTNMFHPCQIITDLFTIFEYSERLDGIKLCYMGDCANNTANSLILAARLAGVELTLSSPEKYKPKNSYLDPDSMGMGKIVWEPDPMKAAENADYIYTDVWVSMGYEKEEKERNRELRPYQVNPKIVSTASPSVKIMHCLPARRGEEITDDVIDSHKSIVFDQAENRLHVQKAILALLLDEETLK